MLRCLLLLREHARDVGTRQTKTKLLVRGRAQIERSVPQPALCAQRARSERSLGSVGIGSDFEAFKNCAHAQFIERALNF